MRYDEVVELLPVGWTAEASGRDGHVLIVGSPPRSGMVTVDFEKRCFRGGCVTTGRPESAGTYAGRGWKRALVLAAVRWLDDLRASWQS